MAKRFLVVTEEWAGSGHRMAALALLEALREKQEVESARLVGGLQTTSPALRELSRFFYGSMLRYGQPLWQYIYTKEKMWSGMLKKPLGTWLSRRFIDAVLAEEKPDVVAATHAYCLSALAVAKQRMGQSFHLVSMPTDFCVNRFWVHPAIDTYIVAHEQVAELLERTHGVQPERIRIHGIPVRRAFSSAADAEKTHWKRERGLSPRMFTVLIAGGEGGYGRMDQVVAELMNREEALQIVVITGKNEALRQRLEAQWMGKTASHSLFIRGYEPELWKWLGAADVYITKPGGISCSEALTMRTPLILYQPLPGQERHNANFFLQHQAAVLADKPGMIAEAVQQMKHGQLREQIVRRMERLRRPAAAEQTAEFLVRL